MDLMLRFADEAEWLAFAIERDPGLLELDEIGTIERVVAPETDEAPATIEALPGWHVNLRCRDDRDLTSLDPFVVAPADPARVWL